MTEAEAAARAKEIAARWGEIVDVLCEAGIAPDLTTVLALAMGVKAFGISVGTVKTPSVMGFMPGPAKKGN